MKLLTLLTALACLLTLTGAGRIVQSKTVYVATTGVDSPTCGLKRAPCHSISQAVANATDGDTILVGPGSYGPDEAGSRYHCGCRIYINKRVRVLSLAGAVQTTINNIGSGADSAVMIVGSGGAFGSPQHGFTVSGGNWIIEALRVGGDHLTIAGNTIIGSVLPPAFHGNGPGLSVNGSYNTIRGNSLNSNLYVNGSWNDIIGNTIDANTTNPAFLASKSRHKP
jgi:hypothetical protein